nr:RtcB family protein [Nitratireductor sp. XY-223]
MTGKTLIKWGFKPGKWFPDAIAHANRMRSQGNDDNEIFAALQDLQPVEVLMRTNGLAYQAFIEPENDVERENVAAVHKAMDELMRVPTVKAGAIMPDACPAGTIPVGAVVATENAIHPGYHSSDICCSMAMTVLKRADDPARLLDTINEFAHFGPTKRAKHPITAPAEFLSKMESNPFTNGLEDIAWGHFTTQGDGNHFYYVGHLRSTGQLTIVSHHGSRGFGAHLYKRGMSAAYRHTLAIAPRVSKANSWLAADTREGQDYCQALQLVREWTKLNHLCLHDAIAANLGNKIEDQFWNEHNFVFQKSDGLFYHAKGATPSYAGFSPDDDGRTIIPMNMAEPILITQHADNRGALGFAPHGAGRNMSRTRFLKEYEPVIPADIDVRFYCGIPDKSELPDAYKSADQVREQIRKHELANVVDMVDPFGSIMAGDWERDAPWRKRKRQK